MDRGPSRTLRGPEGHSLSCSRRGRRSAFTVRRRGACDPEILLRDVTKHHLSTNTEGEAAYESRGDDRTPTDCDVQRNAAIHTEIPQLPMEVARI